MNNDYEIIDPDNPKPDLYKRELLSSGNATSYGELINILDKGITEFMHPEKAVIEGKYKTQPTLSLEAPFTYVVVARQKRMHRNPHDLLITYLCQKKGELAKFLVRIPFKPATLHDADFPLDNYVRMMIQTEYLTLKAAALE